VNAVESIALRRADLARAAATLVLALIAPVTSALDVPYMTGRVVDNAEILSQNARRQIEAKIREHEDRTTNQIAVLTVPSLRGETVEQFATAVFDAWKLGQKDKDNGVLVLVSPAERRLRIEVGYGLEGTLTDVAASRIIRNVITPRFKDGNYDGGLIEGTNAIVAQLEGTAAAPADAAAPAAPSAKSVSGFNIEAPAMPWYQRVLFGAFIFGIIGLFTVIGVMTPGVGWFLYLFLIPFWAMFPIIVVGSKGAFALLVMYLIAYPVAKLVLSRQPWYAKAATELKSKGSATIGGFTVSSGSSSGGFSSGGGSSGGGGGGGGGSSGGGGASGSW
jgi:uncharacterized protein